MLSSYVVTRWWTGLCQWRWAGLWVAALALALSPAQAAEVKWPRERIEIAADGEPLRDFLARVFARLRIPMNASDGVTGLVSGRFRDTPQVIFSEIAESFGLSWYYDGSTMYVYSIAENQTRLMAVDPAEIKRAESLLTTLEIADRRYPVRFTPNDGVVVVSGPPRYVELVEEMVAFLNGRPSPRSQLQRVQVYRLKYAWAEDRDITIGGVQTRIPGVASLVASILNEDQRGAQDPRRLPNRVLPATAERVSGQGLASIGRPPATAPGTPPAVAGGPIGPSSNGLPAEGARLENIGAVRADSRLNAVIVRDTADKMPLYDELIASLDKPAALVEIEASVIDISTERSQSLGMDFALVLGNRGRFVQPPLIDSITNSFDSLATPRASVLLGSDRAYFFAQLNALRQSGDATVQSKPRILTLDNNEAVLQNSQEFFVRVAGRDEVDLFNVNVGLTLRVTPSIVEEDGRTRFKLNVQIDDGSLTGALVDEVPVITRSSINASVLIEDGESVFIGGLVSESSSASRRGVPGLSEVPLLGYAFGTRTSRDQRTERMFLITPRLIRGAI